MSVSGAVKVVIDPQVLATYPGFSAAFLFVDAPRGAADNEKVEPEIVSVVRGAHGDIGKLAGEPIVKEYAAFYKAMGLKPGRVTTPVKQAFRVLKTGSYRSVYGIIDKCMKIEYTTLMSFQAYDKVKLAFPLAYSFAAGVEMFVDLHGEEKLCKQGELILCDSKGVIHSSYYGNAKRASVDGNTKHAVIRILGMVGYEHQFAEAVRQTLAEFGQTESPIVVTRGKFSVE